MNVKADKLISIEEKDVVEAHKNDMAYFSKMLEYAKKFNLGDYCVLHMTTHNPWSDKRVDFIRKNSYGTVVKFKVVHVDDMGFPYLRTIGPSGIPTGPLRTVTGRGRNDDYISTDYLVDYHFELDPDYADSLILGSHYDPNTATDEKRAAWKEITEYNKAHKIDNSLSGVKTFFSTVKPGTVIWRSQLNHFIINKVETVRKSLMITISDKGALKQLNVSAFVNKALYTSRPRSYKELKT